MSTRIDGDLPRRPRFEVRLAETDEEIRATQRLRYEIFAGELGATIDGGEAGLDHDQFDRFCRHLMVCEAESGRIVACTRILTGERAPGAGGFYSSGEFDLAMLDSLGVRSMAPEGDEAGAEADATPASRTHSRIARNTVSTGCRVMEIGRTCVAAEYRSGAVIATLWQGIASYIVNHGYDYLFGCASIDLRDGGASAHAILDQIRSQHMAPVYQHVRPYIPLPAADRRVTEKPKLPPLLKAYLSLGAKACGEAYWDRDFNCADVFMLLNVSDLNPRYARHFLGQANAQSSTAAADDAGTR